MVLQSSSNRVPGTYLTYDIPARYLCANGIPGAVPPRGWKWGYWVFSSPIVDETTQLAWVRNLRSDSVFSAIRTRHARLRAETIPTKAVTKNNHTGELLSVSRRKFAMSFSLSDSDSNPCVQERPRPPCRQSRCRNALSSIKMWFRIAC